MVVVVEGVEGMLDAQVVSCSFFAVGALVVGGEGVRVVWPGRL